ncbi:MAG: cysteine peptidase family C39 domain-containing protein [Muribaculaceae bacterium]|nr:cysteine peptidase family C39 domain-containing protein [Muribaculaceae bacterium]
MAKNKNTPTLIGDYLDALGVRHTSDYTSKRFREMPFQTMFGLTKLLEEYGVESEGWLLSDKSEIQKLTPPFLAHTPKGFVIVTQITPSKLTYMTQGVTEQISLAEFEQAWDGNVILSFPSSDASEPDYDKHEGLEFLIRAKKWVLILCTLFLFLYAFITNGLYKHVSTILVTAFDLGGIYFTYLLVQKSLNIHNPAADRVCSVLQSGGCDSILELKASKFFGLFGWSEVGFSYFSVSLLTLLLFPDMLPWLALCNVCCLPFTFWSIWYQKFRAKKWCTLCVCVQASLWLLFFSYLIGGYISHAWPIRVQFIILGVAYLGVMLAINAVMPLIEKEP